MASIAGKVAPVPKGAWDSTTAYEKLNIVSHNGYVYMAKDDNTGHEPVSAASDTYWMLLVSGGVVSVDSAMSTTSTNPVQNKVIGEALDTAKEEAQEVVSDQYDATVNYGPVGNANGYPSYCIKDDVLYKCIVACVGVAPPNVTYWEATSVGDELSSVNSDIVKTRIISDSLSESTTYVWYSSFYRSSIKDVTFPVTYKETPIVILHEYPAPCISGDIANVTTTGFRVVFYLASNTTLSSTSFKYSVIGKEA